MKFDDETHAVAEVQSRLAKRFPHLESRVIADAVHAAHDQLTGHIRAYVPILVEHDARDRLARAQRAKPLAAASQHTQDGTH